MRKEGKLAGKGQITVPVEIRRLAVSAGDKPVFEAAGNTVTVRAAKRSSRFERYGGSATPASAPAGMRSSGW